ncbi:hypothetical protein [uncultured Campylobacter sp.]|uniref:hypothetical protein n=1 Tax=uncultured Campylobacter sp. TaxID=218934 RepID=UPI002637164E|nr:hypothetical protein [uncultured Campylobacter sp.]
MPCLRFEIPPRNSTPQIHRRNFVLKSSDGIYARSDEIPKFRSMCLSATKFSCDEILKF